MATVEDFEKLNIRVGRSEVLTLGVPDKDGRCVLVAPDKDLAKIGGKLY